DLADAAMVSYADLEELTAGESFAMASMQTSGKQLCWFWDLRREEASIVKVDTSGFDQLVTMAGSLAIACGCGKDKILAVTVTDLIAAAANQPSSRDWSGPIPSLTDFPAPCVAMNSHRRPVCGFKSFYGSVDSMSYCYVDLEAEDGQAARLTGPVEF